MMSVGRMFHSGGPASAAPFLMAGRFVALRAHLRLSNRFPHAVPIPALGATAMLGVADMSEEIDQKGQKERGYKQYVHKNTKKRKDTSNE